MVDYFALLGESRRPWLDPDSLKKKFLTLSIVAHPDHIQAASPAEKESANQNFSALNAAFNCLREPKDRLRHFLELEQGGKLRDVHEIPPDLADLFLEVARLRQEAINFLAERAGVDSPMLKIQFFERAQEWIERLSEMQRRLSARQSAMENELQTLVADWLRSEENPAARAGLLTRLEEIYRLLSFNTRWSLQVREAIVQLTL